MPDGLVSGPVTLLSATFMTSIGFYSVLGLIVTALCGGLEDLWGQCELGDLSSSRYSLLIDDCWELVSRLHHFISRYISVFFLHAFGSNHKCIVTHNLICTIQWLCAMMWTLCNFTTPVYSKQCSRSWWATIQTSRAFLLLLDRHLGLLLRPASTYAF